MRSVSVVFPESMCAEMPMLRMFSREMRAATGVLSRLGASGGRDGSEKGGGRAARYLSPRAYARPARGVAVSNGPQSEVSSGVRCRAAEPAVLAACAEAPRAGLAARGARRIRRYGYSVAETRLSARKHRDSHLSGLRLDGLEVRAQAHPERILV